MFEIFPLNSYSATWSLPVKVEKEKVLFLPYYSYVSNIAGSLFSVFVRKETVPRRPQVTFNVIKKLPHEPL